RVLKLGVARLETGVSQPEALALYNRLGYRKCAPFGAYVHPLSVCMEKELAAPEYWFADCKREDFESVVVLLQPLWPGKTLDVPALRVVYEHALESTDQRYVCALDGRQIIGFGSLSFHRTLYSERFAARVDELVIEEAHRDRSVGKQLLEHLVI